MDWEDFGCTLLIAIFFGMLVALVTLPLWVGYCMYHFNKSDCSVWVDNSMVYNGKCHFVDVSPVGEYGNSKRVSIYYDVRKWHQKQKYISENVEIKESIK